MSIEIRMQHSLDHAAVDILIFEASGRHLSIIQPMPLVFKEHDPYAVIAEPTLRLPQYMVTPFFKAWADFLHKEKVGPTIQGYTEGELMATKRHLADMRQLVLRKAQP